MKRTGSKLILLARVFWAVSFVLVWVTVLSCSQPMANLGEEFSLHIGDSIGITGEDLQVKFVGVPEDSRCPKEVTCIWEGRVSCAVEITSHESIYRIVLTQPGLSEQPARTSFEDYKIDLRVEPYPEAGKNITDAEYLLFLKFSK